MGGGIRMGNTCKPMAVSFQCMTKFTTNKKKKEKKIRVRWEGGVFGYCGPEVRQVDFGSTLSRSRQWVKPFSALL